MKHLKKFNENINSDFRDEVPVIRIKDIIEYLSEFDPEMEVYLDKDGWEDGETPKDVIKNTNLFDTHWGDSMTINN